VLALPGYNPFTGKTMSRTLLPGQEGRDMDSMIQRFGILRRKAMKDSDDMQELIREINAYRPDYLYNYQEILAGIAAYASERGIRVWKPQYYTATGAPLTEETRVLLTEVFGPGLTDSYGLNETGSCIVRLPGKKYYQVNSDTHVVNIYNDSLTGPALTGQAVITPLFKTELPVINYVSGDGMESYQKQGLRFIRTVDSRAYPSGS
jgi:phenylacetate-coenzyme A ligase PaaK-like adenylate-forming protein